MFFSFVGGKEESIGRKDMCETKLVIGEENFSLLQFLQQQQQQQQQRQQQLQKQQQSQLH